MHMEKRDAPAPVSAGHHDLQHQELEIGEGPKQTAVALVARTREIALELPLDLDLHEFAPVLEQLADEKPSR